MRVFFDLDLEILTAVAGVASPVNEFTFKRGVSATLEVHAVRAGRVVDFPPGASGVFGMKMVGEYDADYTVSSLAWAKSYIPSADDPAVLVPLYTFVFSFVNPVLDALFHVDTDLENDARRVTLMAEFQWIAGGLRHKSQTLLVNIDNDVNRGGETSPGGPPIEYSGDKYYRHIQTIPSASWHIVHNLNKRPSITIVDSAGSTVEGATTYLNDNEVQEDFSAVFAGTAECN